MFQSPPVCLLPQVPNNLGRRRSPSITFEPSRPYRPPTNSVFHIGISQSKLSSKVLNLLVLSIRGPRVPAGRLGTRNQMGMDRQNNTPIE